MNSIISSFLRYLLAAALIASANSRGQSCDPAPQVTITDTHIYKHKGVRLTWRILNRGSKPIFVYSTFLDGHHRAAEWAKRPDGLLEIHTSLLHKLDMSVNYYPKAVFLKIEPNSEHTGSFMDAEPTIHIAKAEHVIFTVAYGSDAIKVQEALRQYFYTGTGHPANPIVDWQCVATSNIARVN